MSINLIACAMRCGPIFKGAQKAVVLALAECANDEGEARPSVPEIAWKTGISIRQVERQLPELEDLGVVDIVEKGGGRRANRYVLNVSFLEAAAASIYRTKQKALQDGGDRYAKMEVVAADIRAGLDEAAAPRRFARKRARAQARQVLEDSPAPHAKKTPDMASGVNDGKKICGDADVGPPPTHCRPTPDAVSAHPRHHVTRTPIESFIEPSVGPVQAAGEARKSNRRRKRDGPRLGEEGAVDPPAILSKASAIVAKVEAGEISTADGVAALTKRAARARSARPRMIASAGGRAPPNDPQTLQPTELREARMSPQLMALRRRQAGGGG